MNEQEFYNILGSKFKELREKAGLTPSQVSRRIGFNRSLLTKFEEQGKKISAFRINQLLEVFGLKKIEDIFEAEDEKKKSKLRLAESVVCCRVEQSSPSLILYTTPPPIKT